MYKLGWIPFDERTKEGHEAHDRAVGAMPQFRIDGLTKANDQKKVVLTDFWKHPLVEQALGFKYPRIHQLTGSCVGAGGGNTVFTLSAIEVVRLRDREKIIVPFWLFTYGMSRKRGGLRGRGEGSFGSSFAEAIRLDGILPADDPRLPKYRNADGLEWSESDEYVWSDGGAIPSQYLSDARKYVVKTTSQCRTADDVRDAILNYYPCTDACSYYVSGATVRGQGDNAVAMGRLDSRGGHQTSILGWWEHPQYGELFLYQNQWPASMYPVDPAGGAPCSCWIPKSDMETICREGETYAFSQFDGFPEQRLDKALFMLI